MASWSPWVPTPSCSPPSPGTAPCSPPPRKRCQRERAPRRGAGRAELPPSSGEPGGTVTAEIAHWRGEAAEEDAERTTAEGGSVVRLRAGSRALLAELMRPYRWMIVLMVALLLLQNAGAMAGPYLVKLGIDKGVPPLLHSPRDARVMIFVGLGFALAATAELIGMRWFVTLSGKVGQAILFDLRNRVYIHFQRLSVGFHERYTSGRVIARLTSDMDSISELLDGGVDDLVLSALSVVSVAVILLVLDTPLALVTLISFPFLLWLSRWFQQNSARAYRRTRE